MSHDIISTKWNPSKWRRIYGWATIEWHSGDVHSSRSTGSKHWQGRRMWKSLERTKWEKLSDKQAGGTRCERSAHTRSEWPINHVTAHLAQAWRSLSKLAPHGQEGGAGQAVGNQSLRLRLLHSERLEPCTSAPCSSTQSTKHRQVSFCAHMPL